jgi:hypothetical protein
VWHLLLLAAWLEWRTASRETLWDLDVRDGANLARLVRALAPLHPTLRGTPPRLPFMWDAKTLRRGFNVTLDTDIGSPDLLGEVAGVGGYEEARTGALMTEAFGVSCAVLSLPKLISAAVQVGQAFLPAVLHKQKSGWQECLPHEEPS